MIRKSEHILRKDTVVNEYQLEDKTVKVIKSVIISDKSYEEREREIVDVYMIRFFLKNPALSRLKYK